MKVSTFVNTSLTTVSLIFATTAFAAHHGDDPKAEHQHDKRLIAGLAAALEAQDDKAKSRYQYRHPKQTLEYFGIEPGMKVLEALPGAGWYSKILLPYLGENGHLLAVDYALEMWPLFGGFANEEFIDKKKTWSTTWVEEAQPWRGESGASVSAATFSTIPSDIDGTLDAAVFIRALHNMARFADKGNYLGDAMSATFKALKPGGIVGIVQHQAREDRPDSWATGSNGYLKKSIIMQTMTAAGFEFVSDSDINANPKDQAGEGDIVWRLPPSLSGAKDNEELKAKMLAIGESNRMTLKFRKPS
ncbi:MAG: putative methyltransferase [Arenicella sp.]|jgi:predicted methyltransferase